MSTRWRLGRGPVTANAPIAPAASRHPGNPAACPGSGGRDLAPRQVAVPAEAARAEGDRGPEIEQVERRDDHGRGHQRPVLACGCARDLVDPRRDGSDESAVTARIEHAEGARRRLDLSVSWQRHPGCCARIRTGWSLQ